MRKTPPVQDGHIRHVEIDPFHAEDDPAPFDGQITIGQRRTADGWTPAAIVIWPQGHMTPVQAAQFAAALVAAVDIARRMDQGQ